MENGLIFKFHKILIRVLIVLVCCASWIYASFTKEQLKLAISFKCVEYIEWPNQDDFTTFRIGYFGKDKILFEELISLSNKTDLKGKKIEVIKIDNLSKLPPINMLYVSSNIIEIPKKIWRSIENKKVLLITDNSKDVRYIMINLIYLENEKKYSFQVNKANIAIEGLNVNSKLLLIGGSEVDVRELYRKMHIELDEEKKKVLKKTKLLNNLKQEIAIANKELNDYNLKITKQKSDFQVQENELHTLSNELNKQKIMIDEKNNTLIELQNTLKIHEERLKSKQNEIKENENQLKDLVLEINNAKSVIAKKEDLLNSQSIEMGEQRVKIQKQNLILLLSIALLVTVIIIGYLIYKAYKNKKGIAVILEQQVEERTKDLQVSTKNFQEIFNASSEVILVHDIETANIIEANNAVNDVFGYTPDEIMKLTIADISSNEPPYTLENAKEKIYKALNEGIQLFEWRTKKKNGDLFWSEVALKASEINDKKRVLAVVRDISERKKLLQEQQNLQERLKQSEKLESMGKLAGGIAHDFNNQLTGIGGFAEVIISETKDDKNSLINEYAEGILKSVERSSDLTKQLLAYARKGAFEEKVNDLHQIIDEVQNLLKHSFDKKIVLKSNLLATKSNFKGDFSQIQNAILNLSINARDAMVNGGDIMYSTRNIVIDQYQSDRELNMLDAGEYIELLVSDNGPGIPKEIIQKIFEPFFTTKEKGKGTGMGLAAVYGTVRKHKGNIYVYSEVGIGTEFKIYLPLVEDKKKIIKEEIKETPIEKGSGNILLIDDDNVIRKMGKIQLEKIGYKVIQCVDGMEATQKYANIFKEIDVIILDLVMPRMSGKETFEIIREINQDAKVIICSGYSLNDDAQDLLDKGAFGFIQKPFKHIELAHKVNEAIILGKKTSKSLV